jgi:hypothetical protein
MNSFLHARVWSCTEALELRVSGHVAEPGAVLEAVYTFVHYGLCVYGSYRPARKRDEIGSENSKQ